MCNDRLEAFEKMLSDIQSTAEREKQADQPEKVWGCEEMLQERGVRGTMVIHVQYRQNATWQGKILCVETGETQEFCSMLELLKIIDNEF